MKIYTIGHSNRKLDEFLKVLKRFEVKLVVDVRRFPSSKKFPWFNKENLEKELKKEGILYLHFSELGGYRKEGYEKFARSKEFEESVKKLLGIINEKNAVIMCTELLWWRCHRRYIANFLTKLGHKVIHIFDERRSYEHKLRTL